MTLKKLAIIAMVALFALQAWALSLDDFRDIYFETEEVADFIPFAKAFIDETETLDDIDYAMYYWRDWDSDSFGEYLDSKLESRNPKYRYLHAMQDESSYVNLERARALIESQRGYVGGYRALFLTYCSDFEAQTLENTDSPDHYMLLDDLPAMSFYARSFPHDRYSKLAGLYYYVWNEDQEAALAWYQQLLENEDPGLGEFDLGDLFVPSQYITLREAQMEMLRENDDDPETKYHIAVMAGDVADYYYDIAKDYEGVIDRFGENPKYWENLYVTYCLAMSYINLDRAREAVPLLRAEGDKENAREFQEAWLAFDSNEASAAYQKVLGSNSGDPLNAILLAYAHSDDLKKLEAARALVRKQPKEEDGYSLTAEILLTYFSSSYMDDPQRPQMIKALKDNAKTLRNYYLRFPENILATAGYFLVNAAQKDDDKAFKAYTELVDAGYGMMLGDDMAKFALELGRQDLMKRVKDHEFRSYEDIEGMSEAEIDDTVRKAYSVALFESKMYDEVLLEVEKHPHWMEDVNIQSMVLTTHIIKENYAQAIATLRLMLDSGNIYPSSLEDINITEIIDHPDWQDLLDYAATLPDPWADESDWD